MRVANNLCNPRQRRDLKGGSLGIAASDNDFAVRILTADASDSRSRVLFGGGGYGTGVQDYVVSGVGSVCAGQSSFPELLLDGGTVRLSSPASEIFYVKGGHAPILAYIYLPMRMQGSHRNC